MKILLEADHTYRPLNTDIRKWSIQSKTYDKEKFLYKEWYEDTRSPYISGFLQFTLTTIEFDNRKEAEDYALLRALIV
jgi:hypothetical protein